MSFVIWHLQQIMKNIKKIKAQNTQNIKAHLEPREPKYLVVCEKQPTLVK